MRCLAVCRQRIRGDNKLRIFGGRLDISGERPLTSGPHALRGTAQGRLAVLVVYPSLDKPCRGLFYLHEALVCATCACNTSSRDTHVTASNSSDPFAIFGFAQLELAPPNSCIHSALQRLSRRVHLLGACMCSCSPHRVPVHRCISMRGLG